MSKRMKLLACLAGAAMPCLLSMAAYSADEQFSITAKIHVPSINGNTKGLASFDISWVDPILDQYFLADRSNKAIDVVDPGSNLVVNQLTGCTPNCSVFVGAAPGGSDQSGPDGVLTVDQRYVWAGDGNSRVQVIDATNNALVTTINTSGPGTVHPTPSPNRADELCYDERDHIILIANDADSPPFITFINSRAPYNILGQTVMDGGSGHGHGPNATNGIEQCQWSPRTGHFYINLPQVDGTPGANNTPGAVLMIDPVSEGIDHVWSIPLANCTGPAGMALGPDHQIALGCQGNFKTAPTSTSSVIIDERGNGNNVKIVATLANAGGADEAWFNQGDDHYFITGGNFVSGGSPAPQLAVVDAESTNEDGSVSTAVGSHSVAADPVRNQVYVPVNTKVGGGGGDTAICTGTATDGSTLSNTKGCIAVITTQRDDQDICMADGDHGRDDGNEVVFIRDVCPPSHHDHDGGHDH